MSIVHKYIVKWLSFIILKNTNRDVLKLFRDLERIKIKLVKKRSHLVFNQTCLNNKLLPTYTNIYICICRQQIIYNTRFIE